MVRLQCHTLGASAKRTANKAYGFSPVRGTSFLMSDLSSLENKSTHCTVLCVAEAPGVWHAKISTPSLSFCQEGNAK